MNGNEMGGPSLLLKENSGLKKTKGHTTNKVQTNYSPILHKPQFKPQQSKVTSNSQLTNVKQLTIIGDIVMPRMGIKANPLQARKLSLSVPYPAPQSFAVQREMPILDRNASTLDYPLDCPFSELRSRETWTAWGMTPLGNARGVTGLAAPSASVGFSIYSNTPTRSSSTTTSKPPRRSSARERARERESARASEHARVTRASEPARVCLSVSERELERSKKEMSLQVGGGQSQMMGWRIQQQKQARAHTVDTVDTASSSSSSSSKEQQEIEGDRGRRRAEDECAYNCAEADEDGSEVRRGGGGVVGGSRSEGRGQGLFLVEGILSERRRGKGSKVLSLLALLVQKYAY
jgi:hypothetical protein